MFLQNILKTVNTYSSQSIQKTAEEGTLSNSFSEASITLISKPNKDIHTQEKKKKQEKKKIRKLQAKSLMNIDAKILNKPNSTIH